MKIPNSYQRVRTETALVIVAAKQAAIIYKVEDGSIERLDAFKIPRPRYSDNEGHFRARGKGMVMRAGSTREFRDEEVIQEFIKEFKKRIKEVPQEVEQLYLLAPDKTKKKLPQALPDNLKKKPLILIEGNYYYRNPLFILEKVEKAPREEYKEPAKKGKT